MSGDCGAQDPPKPQVKIPDAGVLEVMTMEGKLVRAHPFRPARGARIHFSDGHRRAAV